MLTEKQKMNKIKIKNVGYIKVARMECIIGTGLNDCQGQCLGVPYLSTRKRRTS